MAIVHLYARTYSGKAVPVTVDEYGNMGGGGGGASSASVSGEAGGWSYAAASGGIVDTSDVTLAAAPGALLANYLSAMQITNKDASVSTEVVIKSGSTVLWRGWAPAVSVGGTVNVVFPRPLVAAGNTALTAACITTSTECYLNAQGFVAGLPNLAAQLMSQGEEVVDDLGAYITDDASAIIYNA